MNTSYEAHLDDQDRIAAEDAERGRDDDRHLRTLAFYERYLAARDMVRRRREEG